MWRKQKTLKLLRILGNIFLIGPRSHFETLSLPYPNGSSNQNTNETESWLLKRKENPGHKRVKCYVTSETERRLALYPYVWFVLWLCFTVYVPAMSTFIFSLQKIITGRKKVVLLSIVTDYNKTTLNLLHVIQLSVQLRSRMVWWNVQS